MKILNKYKIIFFVFIFTIFIVNILLADIVRASKFIAYSMREAELQLTQANVTSDKVRQIGGITRIVGLVYDEDTKDLIIVGQVNKGELKITLDDLVVALRARLLYDAWPEVSIEKNSKTDETGKQEIRFEGGIEDTLFGKDLLDADIILKKLAFGFISADISGIRSYLEMALEQAKISSQQRTISTRFWFYPIYLDAALREGVIAIKELRIGIRTQVLGASEKGKQINDISNIRNEVGDMFAEAVTANYTDFAAFYPPVSRVKPLLDLITIAEGIKSFPFEPDMHYWLYDYSIAQIETPKDYPLLKREKRIPGIEKDYIWELEGGVKLEVYLSKLNEDGDITVIKDLVLKSKPKGNPLTWTVPLDGWNIPGSPDLENNQRMINKEGKENFPFRKKYGMSLTERFFSLGTPGNIKDTIPNFNSLPLQNNFPGIDFNDRLSSHSYPVTSLWTTSGRPQSMTEAQIMSEIISNKHRTLIVGKGPEADLMYNNMVSKLGLANVKRLDIFPGNFQLQTEIKRFGADAVLGIRTSSFPQFREPELKAQMPSPPKISTTVEEQTRMEGINKLRNPMGLGTNEIGGVMLQGVADVSVEDGNESQLTSGTFSLIFENGSAEVDIEKLRKFVTTLWAVYFSRVGPGISIDPIAPGVEKHLVRYIGKIINTDLGRVMREADYTMKKWTVGTEKPQIKGFKSVDEYSARHGIECLGASRRFWFVPEEMQFKLLGNALLFESGRMILKTEYVFRDNKEVKIEPADQAFAQFFSGHYYDIAEKYPIYQELFEYAKLVNLAGYLKEKGVPLLWFLLANKDMVITEDSPGTVDALAKKSDYFDYITIEGGVDLAYKASKANYIIDEQASRAIKKAVTLYGPNLSQGPSVLPSKPITFEAKDEHLTLTPSQTLSLSTGTATGEKYQTDLALRYDKEPGLELVRYYDPGYERPPTFGRGWHLMIPYQVEPYGKEKIEFSKAIIPEKMVVNSLLTGRKEILTFSKDRYSIAGYVPDELKTSNLIGLFLLTDASFRLADKLGNEFQFNQGGRLTEMLFSDTYHVKFDYGYIESKADDSSPSPYRLKLVGDEYEEFMNVMLPKKMKLVEGINGREEIFIFDTGNRLRLAGYVPFAGEKSRYTILALMTDGSFILSDTHANDIFFDSSGRFNGCSAKVVKVVSCGSYKVEFDYEFTAPRPRIRQAQVMRKDQSSPLYSVKYKYGQDGSLRKVTTPKGETIEVRYDGERVLVAMGK